MRTNRSRKQNKTETLIDNVNHSFKLILIAVATVFAVLEKLYKSKLRTKLAAAENLLIIS